VGAVLSALIASAIAAFAMPAAADDTLFMTPIPEGNELRPQITHGTPAKKENWPATLIYENQVGAAVGNCTTTIVGEYVAITAAHCVKKTGRKVILIENSLRDLTCQIHPDYTGGANCLQPGKTADLIGCTADIAVCFTAQPIPSTAAERIGVRSPSLFNGNEVTLVGYGCTTEGVELTGDLQEGGAKILSVPARDHLPDKANPLNDFVHTSPDGAVLCEGDSGSGIYDGKTPASRILKAVGARANISVGSYLVDLSDDRISTFIEKTKGNLTICGIDSAAALCGKQVSGAGK
jgi:hypothetical protein